MRDIFSMQVTQSIGQLFHNISALMLCKFLVGLLLHAVTEGNAGKVLHYYVEVVVGFDDVVDFYYVGVVCQLEDFYLATDGAFADGLANFWFLVGFYSYLLILGAVHGHADRSVGTLSDNFTDDVIFFELGRQISTFSAINIFFIGVPSVRQSREQFIVLAIHFKKLGVGKIFFISALHGAVILDQLTILPNFRSNLSSIHFFALFFSGLFFGFAEQSIEIGFGHEVVIRIFRFVCLFEWGLFPGLVEVDLFECVHEVGDCEVLFVGFVEGTWTGVLTVPH